MSLTSSDLGDRVAANSFLEALTFDTVKELRNTLDRVTQVTVNEMFQES